ncbi:MAG: UMP kinase, partial [Phycisphaerae bacterium]
NDVINQRLGVMDVSAVDLCQRNGIPIVVLNLWRSGNMRDVVLGQGEGTMIDGRSAEESLAE